MGLLSSRIFLEKVHDVENAHDGIAFLRVLGLQKKNQTTLKKQRAHVLAEKVDFVQNNEVIFLVKISRVYGFMWCYAIGVY